MVGDTRAASDTRRIRRLKTPRALAVEASADDVPLRLSFGGAWQEAVMARQPWRIDQQWWRDTEVSRVYFRVTPEDRPTLTIYHDLISGEWFRQEY